MEKKESGVMPNIDMSKIPKADAQNLGATFLMACNRFYDDPKNRRRFDAWDKSRKAQREKEYGR